MYRLLGVLLMDGFFIVAAIMSLRQAASAERGTIVAKMSEEKRLKTARRLRVSGIVLLVLAVLHFLFNVLLA